VQVAAQRGVRNTMCGLWAAAVTVELARVLGHDRGRLLRYAASAEVSAHPSGGVTGFAAISFERADQILT
jgi:AmmeMemoRadiSam system protein B